jgi:hypothetical protein
MTEFKQKRKRRTKKEMDLVRSTESIGLGDTVEKVLEATGIAKVAKWILGEDCGCDKRKEALNKLFTYKRKIECLQEGEYLFLKDFFAFNKSRLKPTEQSSLLRIYNRVFNQRQEPSSCSDCWKRILNDLQKIVNEYEQEHQNVSGTQEGA